MLNPQMRRAAFNNPRGEMPRLWLAGWVRGAALWTVTLAQRRDADMANRNAAAPAAKRVAAAVWFRGRSSQHLCHRIV